MTRTAISPTAATAEPAVSRSGPGAFTANSTNERPKRQFIDICLLWSVPIFTTEVAIGALASGSATKIGGLGLISAISPVAMLATIVLAVSFFAAVGRQRTDPWLLGFHLVGLATILTLAPLLIEHTTRFPTAYLHAGFADYIARHGEVLSHYDARFSWPGFFALIAMLSRLTGVEPLAFAALANIFLVLLELPLVYGITRSLVGGIRRPWLACYFYVVANWVGQDYFGPQGLNLLFYLSVLYLVLRFLRTPPSMPAEPAGPIADGELGGLDAYPVADDVRFHPLRLAKRWWRTLADRETPPVELASPQRVAAIVLVFLILGASVVSHQLTPIGLAGLLFAFAITGRLKARTLPIVLTVMVSAWLSYGATDYWTGHLGVIFGGIGKLSSSVSSNVGARIIGAPSHLEIVHLRLLETVGVGGLAALGLLRGIRRQGGITLALMLGVPVMLVGVQDYGGEALLRVYLYAMPGIAMLLAVLFYPTEEGSARRNLLRAGLAGAVGLGLLALFPFARYGNESFESFSSGDISMARYVLTETPSRTPIVLVGANTPVSFTNIEEHPTSVAKISSLTSTVPSIGDIENAMGAARGGQRPGERALRVAEPVRLPPRICQHPERLRAETHRRARRVGSVRRNPQQRHGVGLENEAMSDPVAPLYRWRREFVLVLVVSALVGVLAHAPSAFRLATVLPAVFICPGLALVGAIGLDNRATVLRLTIPVSAAFSLLVAQTLLTTHAFAPRAGLAIICGVCAAAVAVDYTLGFRRRRA